jgi:multidrug resistance efflux pump
MIRRVGRRRPLMRAAATTAVVVGTATAVSGGVQSHQESKANAAAADQAAFETQAQVAELQAQLDAQQATAAPAAPAAPDITVELEKLGQLKASGVLSDEEFAAAKANLLGL